MQTQALKYMISPSFFYRDRFVLNTGDLKSLPGSTAHWLSDLWKVSIPLCILFPSLKCEVLIKTRVPGQRWWGGGSVKALKMELALSLCLNMFLDKGSYCPSGDQEKVPGEDIILLLLTSTNLSRVHS